MAAGAAAPALILRNLTKAFGAATVLDNVSFSVAEGQTTGLIGPNGAGKTTVFNLITGVETADAGEIILHGRSTLGLSAFSMAGRGLGRTFQEIRLFASLTALENVMVGVQGNDGEGVASAIVRWGHTRRSDRAARDQAKALLDRVGLADLADRLPGEMSYGQQKRVGIARALATGRRLLCLDEPAAGLDPEAASELVSLIRTLNENVGAILLIEHNLELVRECCSHVVFLDMGRVLIDGAPGDVLDDERVWRAFMGV